MPSVNTKKLMLLEGYTDASIRYDIRNHRYDRVKCGFIETDLIWSVLHLVSTLFQLALTCLCSVYLGFVITLGLIDLFCALLLVTSLLFSYVGVNSVSVAIEYSLGLLITWLLSAPGLYVFAGAVLVLSIVSLFVLFAKDSSLKYDLYATPASLYQLAIFPFATATNFFSLMSNIIFCSAYYLMDCFDTRPAYECLAEYLKEHPEIKNICLDLRLENELDSKQLRNVVDSIPSSVNKIELRTPLGQSCSEDTHMSLFKALNPVNREKISFNTQALTEKWESWQNAHTFYMLEQTSEAGRPRLNQDVIQFGIFSYLEPSDMNAMFDALSPLPLAPLCVGS